MSNLPDQLGSNETLPSGGSKISNGQTTRLDLHPDGNLVLSNAQTGAILWSSQTQSPGAVLNMADNGTLNLLSPNGQSVWSMGPSNVKQAHLVVQDDGNLVIYKNNKVDPKFAVWSTQTNGQTGQPIIPGAAPMPPSMPYQASPYTVPQPPMNPQGGYPPGPPGGYGQHPPWHSHPQYPQPHYPHHDYPHPGYPQQYPPQFRGEVIDSSKKAAIGVGATLGTLVAVAGAPLWGAIATGVAGALATPKLISVLTKIFK
jgi:hypothetical protein